MLTKKHLMTIGGTILVISLYFYLASTVQNFHPQSLADPVIALPTITENELEPLVVTWPSVTTTPVQQDAPAEVSTIHPKVILVWTGYFGAPSGRFHFYPHQSNPSDAGPLKQIFVSGTASPSTPAAQCQTAGPVRIDRGSIGAALSSSKRSRRIST